jgi:hypothetical protein
MGRVFLPVLGVCRDWAMRRNPPELSGALGANKKEKPCWLLVIWWGYFTSLSRQGYTERLMDNSTAIVTIIIVLIALFLLGATIATSDSQGGHGF